MKKLFFFCILAVFLLSGCAKPAPEAAAPSVSPSEPASVTQPAAETEPVPTTQETTSPGRPLHTEMEFYPEGMLELRPATLYEGDGYSIYIPDGDFQMTEEGRWIYTANDQLTFEIVFYPDVTENDLRSAITPAPLVESGNGIWCLSERNGTDYDSECLDVWIYPAEGGVYALFSRFFLEAAEGFGSRMATVAASFEITQ